MLVHCAHCGLDPVVLAGRHFRDKKVMWLHIWRSQVLSILWPYLVTRLDTAQPSRVSESVLRPSAENADPFYVTKLCLSTQCTVL